MKQFSGYEESKKKAQYSGSQQIPTGAYICDIKDVRYETYGWGSVIVIAFDVAEGEQKGFFKKQFDANTSDDKKWKGTTRINVPNDDGSESDGWTKDAFARWTDAFENSNKNYVWDWDEAKWKGKKIGIVFGQTGTVINGKEIVFTEAHGCCSVKEVNEGTFYKKLLDLRKKNGYTGNQPVSVQSNNDFANVPEGTEEELPF